ncbi:MAG: hypothetical protein AAF928_11135 [Myxococcota bacterium]
MSLPDFTQPQQIVDAWRTSVERATDRIEAMADQVASAEEAWFARANAAVDERAKLMKGALAYQQQVSTEWRRAWLGLVARSMNTFLRK